MRILIWYIVEDTYTHIYSIDSKELECGFGVFYAAIPSLLFWDQGTVTFQLSGFYGFYCMYMYRCMLNIIYIYMV